MDKNQNSYRVDSNIEIYQQFDSVTRNGMEGFGKKKLFINLLLSFIFICKERVLRCTC
ncbi:hypothetical protein LINPERHAP2_LOCUS40890 [Linum perenne]